MARTVKDAKLESRTARLRLEARHKPHWRTIDQGLHLGYRRGECGGTWRGRMFVDGRYREEKLGLADDIQDPDGVNILSFSEAQRAAHKWADEQRNLPSSVHTRADRRYTVGDVMDDYLDWYKIDRKGIAATQRVS